MFFKRKDTIPYADIHCHLMPGVDDGSQDEATTREMLQIAYKDGIRTICLTPHIRRPWLHREPRALQRGLEQVQQMARSIGDDLKVYLGCEVMYRESIMAEHTDQFIGMNNNKTKYLLVEFDPNDSWNTIMDGLNKLISMGWDPILAHMERYYCVAEHVEYARQLHEMGIYLQVNANSITNKRERIYRDFMVPVLEEHLVDIVSTDAHDTKGRSPELSEAARMVEKLCGATYMKRIFCDNANAILRGEIL